MYVIIAGLLVLLCVSNFHILVSYHNGFKPTEISQRIHRYMRTDLLYDSKDAATTFIVSLTHLLMVVAFPLTYILSVLYARLYMLYKAMSGK